MSLTGSTRYRTNWRGKLILQVEYIALVVENMGNCVECSDQAFWRDARTQDLSGLSISSSAAAKERG